MIECSKNNIVLTGFMATGKTTVGRLLATHLKREFIDTDSLIEKRYGLSIPEIFSRFGETAFRKMERDIAEELGKRDNLVISTGGRLLLDPENVQELSANGQIFCLVASPELIFKRLQHDDGNNRPLLKVQDPYEKIVQLLQEREKGYQGFIAVSTDNKSPNEVVHALVQHFENITSLPKITSTNREPS